MQVETETEIQEPTAGLTDAERAEVEADEAGDTDTSTDTATDDDKGAKAGEGDDKGTPGATAGTEAAADAPAKASDVQALAESVTATAKATAAIAEELAAGRKAPKAEDDKKTDAPAKPDFFGMFDDAETKYDNGELTADEYKAEKRRIYNEQEKWNETQLEQRITKTREEAEASVTQRVAASEANRTWADAVNVFEAVPENKDFVSDPIRLGVFNAMLKTLAQDPEIAGKGNLHLLEEARDRVRTAFNMPAPTAKDDKAAAEKAAEALKKAETERARKKPVTPPNIQDAPRGGSGGDVDSQFAALDAMEVSDREDALARLPPNLRDKYLEEAPGGLRDNPRGA
jgi:hypothetical protein